MKFIKIFFLRRKVKTLYMRLIHLEQRYDCGASMMAAVCPEYTGLHNDLDAALKELNKLDPKCPPARNVNA